MRLIDADSLAAKIMIEAPDFMDGGSSITKAFILAMIKTKSVTPTIDAVPVVRCKECENAVLTADGKYCKYCYANKDDHGYTVEVYHDADWFCANGKRRDDGADRVSDRVPGRMGHHGDCSEDKR